MSPSARSRFALGGSDDRIVCGPPRAACGERLRVLDGEAQRHSGGELSSQVNRHGVLRDREVNVTELPIASYPAAIKAVAPLIDQGRLDEAKAAVSAALDSLVIDTVVIPLPRVRAEALLGEAQQLTSKSNRAQTDQDKALTLIAAARNEVQLAEALGYGSKADYKPLYSEIDDLQKAAQSGNDGTGLFDRVRQSLKRFKFSS